MKQFVPTTALGRELVANRSALLEAAERRRARDVRVFGSVARGENSESSDVDLLVSLDSGASLLDLIGFACDAEDILGVRVDVGTPESLRPHVRAEVLADAATLWVRATLLDRLRDILNAIRVIERYRRRGSIEDELVFDGYRMRLIEIGEAAKDLPAELTSAEPDTPWREIARMRDHLSHRYFDTQREIVERVLTDDLKPLAAAVTRLLTRVEQAEADQTQLDFGCEEAGDVSEP